MSLTLALMKIISVNAVNQENVCCLNSALSYYVVASRRATMRELLEVAWRRRRATRRIPNSLTESCESWGMGPGMQRVREHESASMAAAPGEVGAIDTFAALLKFWCVLGAPPIPPDPPACPINPPGKRIPRGTTAGWVCTSGAFEIATPSSSRRASRFQSGGASCANCVRCSTTRARGRMPWMPREATISLLQEFVHA